MERKSFGEKFSEGKSFGEKILGVKKISGGGLAPPPNSFTNAGSTPQQMTPPPKSDTTFVKICWPAQEILPLKLTPPFFRVSRASFMGGNHHLAHRKHIVRLCPKHGYHAPTDVWGTVLETMHNWCRWTHSAFCLFQFGTDPLQKGNIHQSQLGPWS